MIRPVSKFQIMKALVTEPLRARAWVVDDSLPIVGNCPVCAVGAILRQQGVVNIAMKDVAHKNLTYATSNHQEEDALRHNDYLGALSVHFERQQRSKNEANPAYDDDDASKNLPVTWRDRLALLRFVWKHFPRTIELQLTEMAFADYYAGS